MGGRRWDGDGRGHGVADAATFADGPVRLIDAMGRPQWVAEQPEAHLLPHLERACRSLPLQLVDARTREDGVFDVQLTWTGDEAGQGAVRAAVFSLLGSVAEVSTYVRQRRGQADGRPPGALCFEVVTGILDGDSDFTSHGHTLRLSVTVAA